ncbi:hypothetical protein DNU06_16240 [Putridiphycobacter roseus]|uniref:Uncharacterized protein n=1 Tax=Putridiphycobacter roseus TaxID=2219161 RepID=A0A2W1MZ32_9FLAO|nr:DUF1573 domain-containing protein [Putridiphycobacter roseus]PZE15821.1 hypothetical protein DNU06_16240 [Putridiphycobacter roseus]
MRLTLILLLFSPFVFGQTYVQLVEHADKKLMEGDYYGAILYFQQAMTFDSTSVEINWKMAEAQRKYKNYEVAATFYAAVYEKEQARIYPMSIFWLASMLQQTGQYGQAKQAFKSAKKVFKRDRESYEYLKAEQGFKACIWAENTIKLKGDENAKPISGPVNSNDTEFAPRITKDKFYFTALKADTIKPTEEVNSKNYKLSIYSADKFNRTFSNVEIVSGEGLADYNYGNGCFSTDGKRFYFTRCDAGNNCKIFVGKLVDNKLTDIDSLGEVINDYAAQTTMPHITVINGEEYLFFASNRYKSIGGYDIWASKITDGNQYSKAFNLGNKINSIEDEISPFYDRETDRLYFSSTWHIGFGGFDIFYSENTSSVMQFGEVENAGLPFNSPQNDTYYTVDPENGDAYFSSNRKGVSYSVNPTCCNDIFVMKNSTLIKPKAFRFPDLATLNKVLPVKLYFHNDEPNPKTTDTVTQYNYIQTYQNYLQLKKQYKSAYSKGLIGEESEDAKEDIEDFFVEYIEQGVADLEEFTRLLKIELLKGQALVISIKGFASPLAKSDYNVNLTKRRIDSYKNYLSEIEGGFFEPYLKNGALQIEAIPYGEYTANAFASDNVKDQKNSVYSRKAAIERRIEIQSVTVQDESVLPIKVSPLVYDFGMVNTSELLKHTFTIENQGSDTLHIKEVIDECACTGSSIENETILSGESVTLTTKFSPNDIQGFSVNRILIVFENGFTKVLTTTAEVAQN